MISGSSANDGGMDADGVKFLLQQVVARKVSLTSSGEKRRRFDDVERMNLTGISVDEGGGDKGAGQRC